MVICSTCDFGSGTLYPAWHNYRLTDTVCLDLVNSAAGRGMVVSIPVRVEDRRQRSWLVDIPDVAMEEIATLVRTCPQAQFIIGNATGFTNSRWLGLNVSVRCTLRPEAVARSVE